MGLYCKCKLCCNAINILICSNGSIGHVPRLQKPQTYYCDGCIALLMVCMNLLQEVISCKGDFTQNYSSTVNGVYEASLQYKHSYRKNRYMKIFFCSQYQAISTEKQIIKQTLVSYSFAYAAVSKLFYLSFIKIISPHFNKII